MTAREILGNPNLDGGQLEQTAESPLASICAAAGPAHLTYRADIEGLRAVAILLVVACHAGLPGFAGGFIGVDVFFVLSGYLITGLLWKEIQQTGRVDFLRFYSRRFKRLLPALLLMTVLTILIAGIILAPFEQVGQAETAKAVPLWISNFFFGFTALDYFEADASGNLFLHTWSLAVEEQFYLVWPLLMVAVAGSINWRQAPKGLFLVLLSSLLLSLLLSHQQPGWAFYLMPSRAWQFALGGLVFLLADPQRLRDAKPRGKFFHRPIERRFAGWLGLALIALAVAVLDKSVTYPGLWALLPSLGTGLVLFAGAAEKSGGASGLLSLVPMQLLGKLSYSWYLWHWPVLVLGNIVLPGAGLQFQLLLVGLSLLIAFVSLITIESPLRRSPILARRPLVVIVSSVALMTGGFFLGRTWQERALQWASQPDQLVYQKARGNLPAIYSMGCDEWFSSSRVKVCSFGDAQSERTAVLLGDSVAAQWFTALATPYVEKGWRFLVLTKSACPIVDEPIFYARIGMMYTVCSDWRDTALGFLEEMKPDVVFIGSASSYSYTEEQWAAGTRRVVDRLSPIVEKLYVIRGTYRLPFDGPSCLARRQWQPGWLSHFSDCSAPTQNPLDERALAGLKDAVRGYSNTDIIDLNPLICPEGRCYSRIGDEIVFRDSQHLTTHFVEVVAEQVGKKIDEVEFQH